ncbi:MAG: DUF1657 domain-containing protein [Firmicutes bacterium]|nr:DUF1657 domain-containing protein [Bacillota bacterium]
MTVDTQMQQVLATAKGVQASFETFSLQTKDEAAKQMYTEAAQQLQLVVDGLEKRMEQVEEEEPQYRQ